MDPLPIDGLIPEILAALRPARPQGSLVLEAPPGAGKTTRVPIALCQSGLISGTVLVTEPRRVAAKMAAHRVADERRLKLGEEVGYRVRFDDCATPRTGLVYLTEGMLLREIERDPYLSGVGAVFFDEVHEMSADLEMLMALALRATQKHPALRLVAMSATLNADRWVSFLGGAPRITATGRAFDVEVRYQSSLDTRPLPIQVRSTLTSQDLPEGDVLVFLPGSREIRATEEALAERPSYEVMPLHGDLPLEAQAKVVRGGGAKRRVILATNIAESSLTIPRVTTVIDSGLARVARYEPESSLTVLDVQEVSQARAIQRAGRAGRTAPGVAVRLYTKGNFQARPEQDTPELFRRNLSDLVLLLRSLGLRPEELTFPSQPGPGTFRHAEQELTWIGAISPEITEVGRALLRYPLPVRLGRALLRARELGTYEEACLAVALLSERDIWRAARVSFEDQRNTHIELCDSDLEHRMGLFWEAQGENFRPATLRSLELDEGAVRSVEQLRRQLLSMDRNAADPREITREEGLMRAFLTAFPDRVAERRGQGKDLILSSGTMAQLSNTSGVQSARHLLALDLAAPRGKSRAAVVNLAARVDLDLLMRELGHLVEPIEQYSWSEEKARVIEESSLVLGKVAIDKQIGNAQPSPGATQVLVAALAKKGPATFDPKGLIDTLLIRLGLLQKFCPDVLSKLQEGERAALSERLASREKTLLFALEQAALDETTLEGVLAKDLAESLLHGLPDSVRESLTRDLPEKVRLSGGLLVDVHYEVDRPPWIEARLQNFFSILETPSVCRGRLPLQVHLLAPNFRAVQVTSDLPGFWERHYPSLRRELMRKYPKHLWPEDGRTASPPTPGKIR